MNKSYSIIFFGILAVAMGIGNDESKFIPSELKLIIGFSAIAYGIYLIYKPKGRVLESTDDSDKKVANKKSKPSKIYLAVGVLFLVLTKYLIMSNDYILNFWTVFGWTYRFCCFDLWT